MSRYEPPIEVFIIKDLATLKVVADPLRLKLINRWRGEPRTVKQLAAELEIAPTKLYYHVGLLEAHGLIRVTDARLVSGIVEKRYQATAYKLSVDHDLFQPATPTPASAEGLDVFLAAVLDYTRDDIKRSVRDGLIDLAPEAQTPHALFLGRSWARLSSEQAEAFARRFGELVDEFKAMQPEPADDAQWYELLTGFYPTHTAPGHKPEPA